MAENRGNVEAARALDVHKVRVGRLHQSLKLVRALFLFNRRVEEIDGQLQAETWLVRRWRQKELSSPEQKCSEANEPCADQVKWS